jgi:hypothetical protein
MPDRRMTFAAAVMLACIVLAGVALLFSQVI